MFKPAVAVTIVIITAIIAKTKLLPIELITMMITIIKFAVAETMERVTTNAIEILAINISLEVNCICLNLMALLKEGQLNNFLLVEKLFLEKNKLDPQLICFEPKEDALLVDNHRDMHLVVELIFPCCMSQHVWKVLNANEDKVIDIQEMKSTLL